MKFQLTGWMWGYRVNKKDVGTGFVMIEDDSEIVYVKSLVNAKPLFKIKDVTNTEIKKKLMVICLSDGTVIELKAKESDLMILNSYIKEFRFDAKSA
jgi:hypothetical protein